MSDNKPLSKEKVLEKYPQSLDVVLHYHRTLVLMAMDEYAKQEAIAFGHFLDDGCKYNSPLTNEELYTLYLQQKQQP